MRSAWGPSARPLLALLLALSLDAATKGWAQTSLALNQPVPVLVAYVAFNPVTDLLAREQADESLLGIALNIVALLVMVPVALAQRRTGRALGNEVVVAQSQETWVSNGLSVSLLLGLGVNAPFGWWWAGPVVALLIAGVAAWSGLEAWREAGEQGD